MGLQLLYQGNAITASPRSRLACRKKRISGEMQDIVQRNETFEVEANNTEHMILFQAEDGRQFKTTILSL